MTRRNFADGMEITFGDLNKIPAGVERLVLDRLLHELMQQKSDRFFADGFSVSRVSGTQVSVAAGVGIQTDNTQVSPEPIKRMLYNDALVTKTLDGPDATHPRIDIVSVRANRANTETATRKFKAASTGEVTNETLTVETDWESDILVTAGTAAASPVAPTTPTGYITIAEVVVSAVSGVAASGAITDLRDIMPVGGKILINTLGLAKITAGAETTLDQIVADVDAQLSGGGGGGGGMRWSAAGALGPIESEEYAEKVMLFADGVQQKATVYFMVPNGYVAGSQISMFLSFYSPSASGGFRFKAVTSLVRKNLDAIDSTTNQNTHEPAALTNTVAKMMRRVQFELTDADGEINSVAVAAGDLLKVELERDHADAGDTDTADVRFVPSATEPKLS